MAKGERLAVIPGSPPDLSVPMPGCCFAPRCALADERCQATSSRRVEGPGSLDGLLAHRRGRVGLSGLTAPDPASTFAPHERGADSHRRVLGRVVRTFLIEKLEWMRETPGSVESTSLCTRSNSLPFGTSTRRK